MSAAPYFLAALAVLLAWPVPVLLSRAKWPGRSPFTAMVLWQSIALSGGLSMIGAMLIWGLRPLGANLGQSLGRLWQVVVENRPAETLGLLHVFALSAAGLLGTHLVFILLLTLVRIQRQRRRHRDRLNLLSLPAENAPGTLVISHPAPVAYCLPGGARSVTVLSDGLLNLLSPEELKAVLAHERAHLSQRHHLLQWAFAAWRSALPWLPTSQLALYSVNALIEMLADDAALDNAQRPALIRAIAIVATGQVADSMESETAENTAQLLIPHVDVDNEPVDGAEPAPGSTASRLSRLLSGQPRLSTLARTTTLTVSVLLPLLPATLLLIPGSW